MSRSDSFDGTMNPIYDDDVSLSVDMVEMGVRPLHWFDERKPFDYEPKDQQPFQYQVYAAEFQSISTPELKRSTIDDEDPEANDFDVDPETGTARTPFDCVIASFS